MRIRNVKTGKTYQIKKAAPKVPAAPKRYPGSRTGRIA